MHSIGQSIKTSECLCVRACVRVFYIFKAIFLHLPFPFPFSFSFPFLPLPFLLSPSPFSFPFSFSIPFSFLFPCPFLFSFFFSCTDKEIRRFKDIGVTSLTFWGHVTSSVTWPLDSAYVISYWWSIGTMRLSCTVIRRYKASKLHLPILKAKSSLRMLRVTWPVGKGSKMTTYLEFPSPYCLFTIQHLWGYDDD